jgi:DNA mismatch endonuclease (patch repair protein)
MAAVHATGNKATELRLIALFRQHRITGWRRHLNLPGKPDFAFPAKRFAVFVDGCFWHGCRQHCRMPHSNREYWERKISANKARDRSVIRALRLAGWRVIRIWEHSLGKPDSVAKRMKSELCGREG